MGKGSAKAAGENGTRQSLKPDQRTKYRGRHKQDITLPHTKTRSGVSAGRGKRAGGLPFKSNLWQNQRARAPALPIAANRLQLQLLDFFHHLCLTQKLPVLAAGSSWTRVSLRSSGTCDLHWLGHLELLQYREEKTQESERHQVFHPHHRLSSISLTPSQQRYFFPFLFPFLS